MKSCEIGSGEVAYSARVDRSQATYSCFKTTVYNAVPPCYNRNEAFRIRSFYGLFEALAHLPHSGKLV